MSDSNIDKIFGTEGLIARAHPEYEYRDGQVKMAEAIGNALQKKRHLIVEAGTGTGKTLAYLIPAVAAALQSHTRVVISTGTKNLQEQLMDKDVPFLQRILPKKFNAVYMKGRGNYACIHRIKKAEHQPILEGLDEVDHFDEIKDWIEISKTGDRRELKNMPENLPLWQRLNARGEICIGQKCPEFEPCFVTRMRAKAVDAEIVIVNHHLFFADLSVKENKFGRVLPDYTAVIFDEAHMIEDIAADHFGFEISNYQIEELVRDADKIELDDAMTIRDITRATARVLGLSDAFWLRFGRLSQDGRSPLEADLFYQRDRNGDAEPTNLGEAFLALDEALRQTAKIIEPYAKDFPEAESMLSRTRQIIFNLDFIVSQTEKNYVYWIERRGKGTFLKASPIDVAALLEEKLFDKTDTCILTSATLSSGGKFDFIKDRLGLDAARTDTLEAPSTFNFEKQALLYLPKAMPDPRSPEFTMLAAAEIQKLVTISRGRAFVLTTSNSSMKALYELVSSRVAFPCLLQGTTSKSDLLDRFRETPNAILFGTSSFWQGVDVRGEQLSCVIIDKLPFAVPSDPVVAARSRFIDENGGRSFFDYSVPQAIIGLKQGIGRLIRSSSDRGVIAILDPRLRTKGYGRDFLVSLPRMRITSNLDDLRDLLD